MNSRVAAPTMESCGGHKVSGYPGDRGPFSNSSAAAAAAPVRNGRRASRHVLGLVLSAMKTPRRLVAVSRGVVGVVL